MSTFSLAQQSLTDGEDIHSTMSRFVSRHCEPALLSRQILMLFTSGFYNEVQQITDCIISTNHNLIEDPHLFLLRARVAIELNGFTKEAALELQQALLLDPKHQESLELQQLLDIKNQFKDGLYDKALTAIHDILASDHTFTCYAHFMLGNHLLWKTSQLDDAIFHLQESTRMRSSFCKAWLSYGMASKRAGNLIEVQKAFAQCIEFDSNTANHRVYQQHLQNN